MKPFLLVVAMTLVLTGPLSATDRYFSLTGNDTNPGTAAQPFQSPLRAFASWQLGDRVWLIGPNYKLLVSWDAKDAELAAPVRDIAALLRPGGELTRYNFSRRRTATHLLQCTIDPATTYEVQQ